MRKSYDNTKQKLRKMFNEAIEQERIIPTIKQKLDTNDDIKINLDKSWSLAKQEYRYSTDWTELTFDSTASILYIYWKIQISNMKLAMLPFIQRKITIKSTNSTFQTTYPATSHKIIVIDENEETGLYTVLLSSSIAIQTSLTNLPSMQGKLDIRIINPEIFS